MKRFERDLHILSVFTGSEDLIPLANPKIYIRSKWKPCAWDISLAIKRRLRKCCKALEPKIHFHPVCHNILPHQLRTIGFIKKNPKLMVVQTDKGLEPGAIKPREYFQFATRDHLGDTWTYQRLSPAATAYRATSVLKLLDKWIKTYMDVLRKEERKFLCTNLRLNEEPWGFLYLLFKVHKVPQKTRLVVSYCRSLLFPLGQLITEWLQPLTRIHKSYFQDSFTLKKELDLQKSCQTPAYSYVMLRLCTLT